MLFEQGHALLLGLLSRAQARIYLEIHGLGKQRIRAVFFFKQNHINEAQTLWHSAYTNAVVCSSAQLNSTCMHCAIRFSTKAEP